MYVSQCVLLNDSTFDNANQSVVLETLHQSFLHQLKSYRLYWLIHIVRG